MLDDRGRLSEVEEDQRLWESYLKLGIFIDQYWRAITGWTMPWKAGIENFKMMEAHPSIMCRFYWCVRRWTAKQWTGYHLGSWWSHLNTMTNFTTIPTKPNSHEQIVNRHKNKKPIINLIYTSQHLLIDLWVTLSNFIMKKNKNKCELQNSSWNYNKNNVNKNLIKLNICII